MQEEEKLNKIKNISGESRSDVRRKRRRRRGRERTGGRRRKRTQEKKRSQQEQKVQIFCPKQG